MKKLIWNKKYLKNWKIIILGSFFVFTLPSNNDKLFKGSRENQFLSKKI